METLKTILICGALSLVFTKVDAQKKLSDVDKAKPAKDEKVKPNKKEKFTDNYFEDRKIFLKRWNSYNEKEKELYKREYKMFQRADNFWFPRLQGGNGSIKEYNYLLNKLLNKKQSIFNPVVYTPCINWRPIGIEVSQYTGVLGIGRLTTVKFHNNYNHQYPKGTVPPIWDEGANTFYASAPTGGMWKSEDGGANWFNMKTDFLPFLGVTKFELSKKNNNELFVVSGTNQDQSKAYEGEWGSMALFHTLDGGLTWNSCGSPFSADWSNYTSNRQYVGDLEIFEYPTSSGLTDFVLVASELGIHKSLDHGQTWKGKLATFHQNSSKGQARFGVDPLDNRRVYVTTSIDWNHGVNKDWDADTIYYTNTAGEFWNVWQTIDKHGCDPTQLSLGLPTGNDAYIARNEVLVSHTNSNTIYVIVQVYINGMSIGATSCLPAQSGEWLTYMFKSTDRGNTWTRLMNETKVIGSGTTKSHYGIFTINPMDDNQIYLSRSMATSAYNIAHWDASASNFRRDNAPSQMHADFRALDLKTVADCGTNKLYALAGTDGGLNLCEVNSSNLADDGNNVWTNVTGTGLQVGQIYRHSASTNSKYMTFGAADIGSWVRNDYGMQDWRSARAGDGMDCVYDYADDQRFYNTDNQGSGTITYNTPFTSPGSNLKPVTGPFLWVSPLEIDPNNHESILAGYDYSVYKSATYPTSSNWTRIEVTPYKTFGNTVAKLAISPANSDVMFVSCEWPFDNGSLKSTRLYKTTDGGVTWNASGQWWSKFISGIAIDKNGQDIYVSTSGHHFWASSPQKVKRSTDQGATWQNWSGSLPDVPVNCVIVDQATSEVFIGTDYGVYRRKPTDNDWTKVGCRLPNVIVTDLSIAIGPKKEKLLRASTFGRGMWEAQLTQSVSSKQ